MCAQEPTMSTASPSTTPFEHPGAARVLILSTIAFTLLFAVWLQFGMLGKSIAKDLALTQAQIYWAGFTAVMAGALLRLPAGILTDRIGGRLAMTGMLALTAVPCFLLSTAHTFTELLTYAALFGFAGNSFAVGIAWNSAWFSRQRQGTALGLSLIHI
jgi:NNP family nitrate/nitrite transporter-like MFS transporter